MAKITAKQLKTIHTIKGALAIDDDDFRHSLISYFPAKNWNNPHRPSTLDLTAGEAGTVIDHLKRLNGQTSSYPGRPQKVDRNKQLKKIEALLAAGGKSWAYGDGMAKRICKVDKVEWIPDRDLRKIITALIKQGQREGWAIHEL